MKSGKFSSLKSRSIAWITGLVAILSCLTFITLALMRHSLHQLSGMIELSILANNLSSAAGSVTEGLPFEIESYSLHPEPKTKRKILAGFAAIKGNLSRIEPLIQDDQGKVQFALVKNMFQSSHEKFQEIDEKLAAKKSFSEINELTNFVKESSGLTKEAVGTLMSIELGRQQIEKKALAERADKNAGFLLLSILLLAGGGIFIFYRGLIRRSILSPLSEMQNKMEKIACDTGDIKLRVRIDQDNEIGALAGHFNRMADSLQTYKEHLEVLVEERTAQLKDAQAMLVQSGKMSALGEMAGGVAHEINNPLAIIQISSSQMIELLNEEKIDKPAVEAMAAKIEQTTERIARIIKGLRSFSRNAANDPFSHASLLAIVEDTLSLCAEKIKVQNVQINVTIPASLTVECRPTEISQVLLNLVGNAFDALREKNSAWIEIGFRECGSFVELLIKDSGPGIDPKIREKIFQPFFTTKDIGKGTGLGLSISKGIVEAHGGSLSLDADGPNTCFVLRLPRAQAKKAA